MFHVPCSMFHVPCSMFHVPDSIDRPCRDQKSMGVARIFQRGGHTDSYRGYSSDCHLNVVSCLLTRRLTTGGGGHGHPRTPPGYVYEIIQAVARYLDLSVSRDLQFPPKAFASIPNETSGLQKTRIF